MSSIAIFFAMLLLAPQRDRLFSSSDGSFSVRYPKDWEQLEGFTGKPATAKRLDIINFPNRKRAEGVVIIRNGAEIILSKVKPGEIQTPIPKEEFISQSEILPKLLAGSPCYRVLVVHSHWEVGPGVFESDVSHLCTTATQQYSLQLRFFENDPKHDQYEQTAIEILRSLRSSN